MSRLCFLIALAFVISFATAQNYGEREKTAFLHSKIIPDVLDVVPTGHMSVNYPNSAALSVGDVLTPTQAKNPPRVTWDVTPRKFYTFMMTDPDAPSREKPSLREWLHWLVVNVPGDDVGAGDTIAEYVGAGPAKDTGPHRYVFLVYEQPEPDRIVFDEPRLTNRSMANRAQFSVSKFAWKYNLGNPVAGNFYYAQWDDYVPILYEQLGARARPRARPRVAMANSGRLSTTSSTIVLTSVMMLVFNI